ncbi:DUF4340 domain-containing protein [Patescibacteria group bacterium]|nr:DUF4340 domain-containing protein [Patescibacteria group bacterium]
MALKKFQSTLVLVVVFAALLVFVYFVEKDREVKDEKEVAEETYNVIDIDKTQVKEIIFEQPDKKTRVIKEGEGWKIIEPITYQARASKIDETLDTINKLEGNQKIDSTDLTEFKLDKPVVKVTLLMKNDTQYEILLGDKNPQESGIYVKTSTQAAVYLANNTLIETQLKLDEEVLKED